MNRLLGIWCSLLAAATLASGKAIDVARDLESDESQVLPHAVISLPAISSVSSSHSFSKSGSQSFSKSESSSGSHSFSKSGRYSFGQDGVPQLTGHVFSASSGHSSSNSGESSSSESSSHSVSHIGAVGIPHSFTASSSQAASNNKHQSSSDSSSHAFSHSAALDTGLGAIQSYTQSGSEASSKNAHQSSSDSSSQAFSHSGAIDTGLGAIQSYSQSGSEASSKNSHQSSSESKSQSFSNSGAIDIGHGGFQSFSQSGNQASSNAGQNSDSDSLSHSLSNTGEQSTGLGLGQAFSQSGSQAGSNAAHQSSSDSSSQSLSNSGALTTGIGSGQAFSQSGSEAYNKNGLQSSSQSSSHSSASTGQGAIEHFSHIGGTGSDESDEQTSNEGFGNVGLVNIGQGGIEHFSQIGSSGSDESDEQLSSEINPSLGNIGSVSPGQGIIGHFGQIGGTSSSESDEQSSDESFSHSLGNIGTLEESQGGIEHFGYIGSIASGENDDQSSEVAQTLIHESGLKDSSGSLSQSQSNSGTTASGEVTVNAFSGANSQSSSSSGHQASSESSNHSLSGSSDTFGLSNSFSGSQSAASSNSGNQGSSSTASSQSSSLSHGESSQTLGQSHSYSGSQAGSRTRESQGSSSTSSSQSSSNNHGASSQASGHASSGAVIASTDKTGIRGQSLTTEGVLLVALDQTKETSTPLSILAAGNSGNQPQISDGAYTHAILPQGANYDSQNNILESTYIRSGIEQANQNEISGSGVQNSNTAYGKATDLTPPLEVGDIGSQVLANIPVANENNRDTLVILNYNGGNEAQSYNQGNLGNSATYGTNYVLVGGRQVVSQIPKVHSTCYSCNSGGIEHITNTDQSKEADIPQVPISTSYQTIIKPSEFQYETSVLNGGIQKDSQDGSRIIVHSTYHPYHPTRVNIHNPPTRESTLYSQDFSNPVLVSVGSANNDNNAYHTSRYDQETNVDRLNQFYGAHSPSYASFDIQNTQAPSRTSLVTGVNSGSSNDENIVFIGNQSRGKYSGHVSPTILPAVENGKWTIEELIRSFNATPTATTVPDVNVPVPAGSSESTITSFGANYRPPVQATIPVALPGSSSSASSHSSATAHNQQASSSSQSSATAHNQQASSSSSSMSSSSSGSVPAVPVLSSGVTYITPVDTFGNLPLPLGEPTNIDDGGVAILQLGLPQSFINSQSGSNSEASGNSQKSSSSSSSSSSSKAVNNIHQGGFGSVSSSKASSSSGINVDGSLSSISSSQSSSFSGDSGSINSYSPSTGGIHHSIISVGNEDQSNERLSGSSQVDTSYGNPGKVQYVVPVFGSIGGQESIGSLQPEVLVSESNGQSSSSGNNGEVQYSSGSQSSSSSSSSSGTSGSQSSSESSSTSGTTRHPSFFGKIKTFFKRIPTYFKSSSSSHSSSQSQSSSSSSDNHSYSSSSSSSSALS